MQMYRRNGYDITMDVIAHSLGMLGPTEIFYSFDTYQFNDYNRYDATMIDARHKEEMRDTQFPKDLERAYELGKRLVNAAK
ncbi:MAG: Multimeric flavodoxin WrbA [bacterium P201]|nr:MAG: Multimeric flavodoxin WrbA [bacterium P201]